jgi:putative DNA methylase
MAAAAGRVDLHAGKELAYLLYSICERKGWNQPAALFNGLGTSWNDLESLTRSATGNRPADVNPAGQGLLSFDHENQRGSDGGK